MKRILLCTTAPLATIVLGWLAIAHAQKQGTDEISPMPVTESAAIEAETKLDDDSPPRAPAIGDLFPTDTLGEAAPRRNPWDSSPAETAATTIETETVDAAAGDANRFDQDVSNEPTTPTDIPVAPWNQPPVGAQPETIAAAPVEQSASADGSEGQESDIFSPAVVPQPTSSEQPGQVGAREDEAPLEDPFGLQRLPLREEPAELPSNAFSSTTDSAATPFRGAEAAPREIEAANQFENRFRQNDAASTAPPGNFASEDALLTTGTQIGRGVPGDRSLEGPQSPQLTVEKIAPAEVQVGRETTFAVAVRNVGSAPIEGIVIEDRAPQGARMVSTSPPATVTPGGALVWELATLSPGEQSRVEMTLVPLEEGEIGSVATVFMQQRASARTLVTRPELQLQVASARQVLQGDSVTVSIQLSNKGTGAASGVVLENALPEQLQHPAGRELELLIGELRPGETIEKELTLTAAKAGKSVNLIRARGEGGLVAEQQLDIEVTAPEIAVAVAGPRRRYLETKAQFEIEVANPGTAKAEDVRLVAHLSPGLKFVQANNAGQYDAAAHAVQWNLVELPAQRSGAVSLIAEPLELGEETLRVEAAALAGLSDRAEHKVAVEGLAALFFEVADVDDPIEAGAATTYEIRVVNQGSKAATGVQLIASLPDEMTLVDASGPANYSVKGRQVVFGPLRSLGPKADTLYRMRVKADRPGDLRLKVQVLAKELESPVTKEESTRVYSLD